MVLGSRLVTSIGMALGTMLSVSQASASAYEVVAVVENDRHVGISGPLAVDGVGNLYGEMQQNLDIGRGPNGGDIFTLPVRSHYSRVKVLYTYPSNQSQLGQFPMGGVTLDHGQVIGTTGFGGPDANGTIFNLGKPSAPALTVLHGFQASKVDGLRPDSGLVLGPSHLFYGTTKYGGIYGDEQGGGTMFATSGSATPPIYRVLVDFGGGQTHPTIGRLAVDSQGRLYGETASLSGSVFMLQETALGWQEHTVYGFSQLDFGILSNPYDGNVVLDNAGNLYGCTAGGTHRQGAVFRLTPPASIHDSWQPTVLYNFGDQSGDPIDSSAYPGCEITIDPASLTIVGTSRGGGNLRSGKPSAGTIWQLKPPLPGGTHWREAVKHSFFGGVTVDGGNPQYPPLLVGKTYYGGNSLSGAIYAFTPDE